MSSALPPPIPWAPAIQNGVIQDAETAADAVANGNPLPVNNSGNELTPGSRLSVVFNPGVVQRQICGYLDPRDLL